MESPAWHQLCLSSSAAVPERGCGRSRREPRISGNSSLARQIGRDLGAKLDRSDDAVGAAESEALSRPPGSIRIDVGLADDLASTLSMPRACAGLQVP
jgi:hypothetical protein